MKIIKWIIWFLTYNKSDYMSNNWMNCKERFNDSQY